MFPRSFSWKHDYVYISYTLHIFMCICRTSCEQFHLAGFAGKAHYGNLIFVSHKLLFNEPKHGNSVSFLVLKLLA